MMLRISVAALALLTNVLTVHGQEPANVIAYSPLNIEFMSAPIAFDTEPVTGAPYSAEAITDIVQTLADGNRIVRQNKAQISRDSQGRTRREEGFAMFGPLVNGPQDDVPRSVQISDPASGNMVMLDLRSQTAHKMTGPPRLVLRNKIAALNAKAGASGGWKSASDGTEPSGAEKVEVEKFEMAVPASPGARGSVMFSRMGALSAATQALQPVVESLGTEFMEGVAVDGTRTTHTIPAGQIGNELPITIVSERWFSPDLKVLVMSRQSDPRFGETTYRLTNITRTEPPPQLFEIPADFTIVDPVPRGGGIAIERRMTK